MDVSWAWSTHVTAPHSPVRWRTEGGPSGMLAGFLCCFPPCSPETGSLQIILAVLGFVHRLGWPQTHREPPASASQVLGLKACATTAPAQKSSI